MAIATLEDAREVTLTIVRALDPQLVFAFGSVGRTGTGNDLDLLIVVDGERREERLSAVLKPFATRTQSSWMDDAREGLRSAEYLARGGFAKAACYHAQQAVEKACKARLLGRGWILEKVHSIRRLVALAADYRIQVALADAEIDFIDGIHRGRHPGEAGLLPLGEPTDEDARRAIEAARIVLHAENAGGRT